MCRDSRGGVERPWTHCNSQPNLTVKMTKTTALWSWTFPSFFLSEGKAMELFRKLREKPRGLDVMHLFTPYITQCFLVKKINNFMFSWFSISFPCSDQRCPGDSQEVVRLVVQAVQFYEKKLRDFYTHLRYSGTQNPMFLIILIIENNLDHIESNNQYSISLHLGKWGLGNWMSLEEFCRPNHCVSV